MEIKTLAEAPITSGTRVLLRAGLNVPIDANGNPTDGYRLRKALPAIEYLAGKGARTIIVAHLGREGDSLQRVAQALQSLTTKTNIRFFDGPLADASLQEMLPGQCLFLQNIRRENGEETNDAELAKRLAALGDVFVNDAFADSHRAYASIVGVANLLPSFAGLLMQEEIAKLCGALMPPRGALAIVGGAKFETKEPLITKLIKLYTHVCVGGALANDFFKARGKNIGASLVSSVPVPEGLAENPHIALPMDGWLRDGAKHAVPIGTLTEGDRIVDAGPETVREWSIRIKKASFILWNGTLGVCEKGFCQATQDIARAIAASGKPAIIGGGDTIAAVEDIAFDERKVFRSTGGGAMLQFLTDGTLPGIEVLKK